MPFLAALIGSAMSGLFTFLAQYVTKKVAVAATLGAFFFAGWLAVQVSIHALATALTATIPDFLVGPLSVVAYLLPDNFDACMGAITSALMIRWVWERQREWAKAVAAI